MKTFKIFFAGVFCAAVLSGCATNPVTGKRELRLFSDKEEVALGQKTRDSVIKQYGRYEDPALENYIAGIGARIAAVCDRKSLNYSFYVLNTDMVNAFAAPGGYIFVTKGILKELKDESELAGVIGHEIGHVTARHSMKALEKQYGYSLALNLASIASGKDLSALQQYTDYLTNMLLMGYGRDNEFQADNLGVRYASAVGYDPQGMIDFFGQLEKIEGGKKASAMQKLFMSHPPTRERIKAIQNYLASAPRPANMTRNASSYAAAVKGIQDK